MKNNYSVDSVDEKHTKNKSISKKERQAISNAVDSALGAASGAVVGAGTSSLLGAAIGSTIIPIAGTIVGAAVGVGMAVCMATHSFGSEDAEEGDSENIDDTKTSNKDPFAPKK